MKAAVRSIAMKGFDALKTLIVDDSISNLSYIKDMASSVGLDPIGFLNPLQALDYMKKNEVDMVFTDYLMPEMDGISFIKGVRGINSHIPVVMITSMDGNRSLKLVALESGANDFLTKPIDEAEFAAKARNMGMLRKAQLVLKGEVDSLNEEIKKATREICEREHETIMVLGKAAEHKDPDAKGHILRVASYAGIIARGLALGDEEQKLIYYASTLHDIGKIGIRDSILMKEGKITPEEFEEMKTHSKKGHQILKDAKSPYLKAASEIALTHHERFDGEGYPKGLRGDSIPLYGRITAIADVFDALMSKRPYKEAWEMDKVLSYLKSNKGAHFDPTMVDVFLENIVEIAEINSAFR